MSGLIIFDGWRRDQLLPFTFTRPSGDLRCGALTIAEKWGGATSKHISFLPVSALREKYTMEPDQDNLLVEGSLFPEKALFDAVFNLEPDTLLKNSDGNVLAARLSKENTRKFADCEPLEAKETTFSGTLTGISNIWDIFTHNGSQIEADLQMVNPPVAGQNLLNTNFVTGSQFYAEAGAISHNAFIDTTSGPVWLAKNAEIQSGAMIKGPLYVGENATIRMGAKIYGPTTIGHWCKVGGEINNSVFHSYSNKAHDGFIGNAVIGQWCNIGADTNNSNLKNNYEEVKVWSYREAKFVKTGLQFCGLFMGDHTKCGINTMFNTGTVIGVSANVFGDGFPRTFIPSFSWGGAAGFREYKIDKAIQTAEKVMLRRNIPFTAADRKILESIYTQTQTNRT